MLIMEIFPLLPQTTSAYRYKQQAPRLFQVEAPMGVQEPCIIRRVIQSEALERIDGMPDGLVFYTCKLLYRKFAYLNIFL